MIFSKVSDLYIQKELLHIMERSIQYQLLYLRIKQIGKMVLLLIVGQMLQELYTILKLLELQGIQYFGE